MMRTTEQATVVYLKSPDGRFCVAPKKGNIHKAKGEELKGTAEKLNGFGGKQEPGETILQTAIRELFAESTVVGREEDLELVAKINFFWPGNETNQSDMVVYFFFLSVYEGEPQESEEMGPPEWFFPGEFMRIGERMNTADKLFLPQLLAGEKVVYDIFFPDKAHNDETLRLVDKKGTPAL